MTNDIQATAAAAAVAVRQRYGKINYYYYWRPSIARSVFTQK